VDNLFGVVVKDEPELSVYQDPDNPVVRPVVWRLQSALYTTPADAMVAVGLVKAGEAKIVVLNVYGG
jgi:hypothetical protein